MARNRFLLFTAVLLAEAAVLLAPTPAFAMDLPFGVTLQFGFSVNVVPAAGDTSRQLGLIVTPERVITDKQRNLVVHGSITNAASVPYSGLDLRFAVSSYTQAGTSFGHASVTPDYIPPGGTARFEAYIFLNQEKPQRAAYTLTAHPAGVVYQEAPPVVIYQQPTTVIEGPVVYYSN